MCSNGEEVREDIRCVAVSMKLARQEHSATDEMWPELNLN